MDVNTFCERSVDVMGEESDHIHAQALTDAVEVSEGRNTGDGRHVRVCTWPGVVRTCWRRCDSRRRRQWHAWLCRQQSFSIQTSCVVKHASSMFAYTACACLCCCYVQVPIRIIYMSAQEGDAPVDMKPEHLSPEQQAALGEPKVHMLYRPGHYDCLYPKSERSPGS